MAVKLLTEKHLEFLSLKGDCTGSSESNLSKCHVFGNHMPRLICFETDALTGLHEDFKILRQGQPWLRICCSQIFSQMEKV